MLTPVESFVFSLTLDCIDRSGMFFPRTTENSSTTFWGELFEVRRLRDDGAKLRFLGMVIGRTNSFLLPKRRRPTSWIMSVYSFLTLTRLQSCKREYSIIDLKKLVAGSLLTTLRSFNAQSIISCTVGVNGVRGGLGRE